MTKFLKVAAALLSIIAMSAASAASFVGVYQPRTPKTLR